MQQAKKKPQQKNLKAHKIFLCLADAEVKLYRTQNATNIRTQI